MRGIKLHSTARCGYATVHDVRTHPVGDAGHQEDRMESFFLAETTKSAASSVA
jgi:hypothetical protein